MPNPRGDFVDDVMVVGYQEHGPNRSVCSAMFQRIDRFPGRGDSSARPI